MGPDHAVDSAENRQLSRLGELLARGAQRQRRRSYKYPPLPCLYSDSSNPILEQLSVHGDLSAGEVVAITGMSRSTAHRRLADLVDQGVIVRSGKGRACRYLRTENR